MEMLPFNEQFLSSMHQEMTGVRNKEWVLSQIRNFAFAHIVVLQTSKDRFKCGTCTKHCERTEFYLSFWKKRDGTKLFEIQLYTGSRFFVHKMFHVLFEGGNANCPEDFLFTPLPLPQTHKPVDPVPYTTSRLDEMFGPNVFKDCRLVNARQLARSTLGFPVDYIIDILPTDSFNDFSRCLHASLQRVPLSRTQAVRVRSNIARLMKRPFDPTDMEQILAIRKAVELVLTKLIF